MTARASQRKSRRSAAPSTGVQLVLTVPRRQAAEIRTRVMRDLADGDPGRRKVACELLIRAASLGRALGKVPEAEFVAFALTLIEAAEAGRAVYRIARRG